jgi:hypothetical protein
MIKKEQESISEIFQSQSEGVLVYRLEEKTHNDGMVSERANIYDEPKVIFELTNKSVEEITTIDFSTLKPKPSEESQA